MVNVKVYSTDTCPWCVKVKDYLAKNSITFQDLNVGKDRAALDEMMKVSGQMAVPVITIDEYVIIGFDQKELAQKLGIK